MALHRGTAALAALLLTAVSAAHATAARDTVALTFDDLPTMMLSASPAYARTTTRRLLHGLHAHHLPAIGFVIGQQLEGPARPEGVAVLHAWRRAGYELGNHSYSHESLNHTPEADYAADVARDDALLREVVPGYGRKVRWFRHPYLETGATLPDKQAFEAWLGAHNYRIAPVTMENSDYIFSPSYDDALVRGDKGRAAKVRAAYLDYTTKVVAWYQGAGDGLVGRPMAYVFLLHATRLNADSLDELSHILRHDHLRVVSLKRAMADPVYTIKDDYADPEGDEWLTRWAHVLGRALPWATFPDPPADYVAESERLDPS